jgi:DNA-binding NarL/FixJ family response regulator
VDVFRVAIIGTNDVVRTGLRALLEKVRDIDVVDLMAFETSDGGADVIIYDGLGLARDDISEFSRLVASDVPVVVLAYPVRPDLAARASAVNSTESVSVEASAVELAEAVRRAATGAGESPPPSRLGAEVRLSVREVQVLAGITQGLSNHAIAERLAVKPNTLKTHIRNAYKKMGIRSRSQAVAWCLVHGFEPPSYSH